MRAEEDFDRFVLQAYPALVRRAFLLVGDHGLAEDLVQTALAAAYPRWRTVQEPTAYLRTVMVRTAVGWRARRWAGERPTEDLPDHPDLVEIFPDVDLVLLMRDALMSLPMEQRAVIVLRYFDDCSEAEIAAALRCSPGTVKSRASRALAALRTSGLLAEEGQNR